MTGIKHKGTRPSLRRMVAAIFLSVLLVPQTMLYAGGPLYVGGPSFGQPGVPLVWDTSTSKPIHYRVDSGVFSKKADGTTVIDNTAGLNRIAAMIKSWTDVPTANISFKNDGAIAAVGTFAGGNVNTADQFLQVQGDISGLGTPDPNSCAGGGQNPIVFDADGSILRDLGYAADVAGFSFLCAENGTTGKITASGMILNGAFQDGDASNNELTAAQFNQAFTREFGTFLGLGNSQINVDAYTRVLSGGSACTADENAGMPVMFPVLGVCTDRATASLPALSMDDMAWISKLYPVTGTAPSGKQTFASTYVTVKGTIYFYPNGGPPAQGVNLVARNSTAGTRNAVSVVSGFLFTGNPGQKITCQNPANPTAGTCSNFGSKYGSHDALQIGYYELPLPVASGLSKTYSIKAESINSGFIGTASVGPLDPPIASPGPLNSTTTVTLTPGSDVNGLDLYLTGVTQKFDAFESAATGSGEIPLWMRREELWNEERRA